MLDIVINVFTLLNIEIRPISWISSPLNKGGRGGLYKVKLSQCHSTSK